ncbi:MAG TPA: putative 2OG-Fe(II) oxygenase [Sphingorhabdus sp.]|nr:putative 2OG-Fe(II) oxygenase [Sphingorhabdus sp.]
MNNLVQRAAELRATQHMEEALDTIRKAVTLNPDDPRAAFGLAQISFECWQPAADLFAKARQLVPANADIIRNHALALAAEGETSSAQLLLEETLAATPGWVEGHRILAVQRITEGDGTDFDRSFVIAAKAEPQNVALYMAWFQLHAQRKDWERAANVLRGAQGRLPGNRTLELAALYLASESGDARNDRTLFDTVADVADPGIDLCRVRHHLRAGDPNRAMAIAERHLTGPTARMFWPYLALCWRLLDDPRAAWLDGAPIFATALDLEFSPSELDELAEVLRGLHRLKAPYPDQSVRGGTQTDRQLFFHPHPAIQKTRQKVSAAVQSFIDALPAQDADHPLLGPLRNQPLLFEGSWSVRLAGDGYHAAHTHVMGWISSALYIVVPEPDVAGPAPAGHLALGAPPPELKLGLPPYRHIEPKPGRLALFPSTLWHGTEPFAEGERMTIAVDIRIPPIIKAF